MPALLRVAVSLLAQAQSGGRWVPPPSGTLRRGVIWLRTPRVVVAVALVLVVVTLGAALYRRLRRR